MEETNTTQPAATGRFRKKPVVIEAWQFPPAGQESAAMPAWLVDAGRAGTTMFHPGSHVEIKTLEGTMRADAGDWIIRGVKGELYPCKPEIFAATYDAAEDDGEPEQKPDAIIGIHWTGAGFKFDITRAPDLTHPAAYIADWIGRNGDAITGLAGAEFNLYREKVAAQQAQLAIARQQLQQQAEGDEKPAIDLGRPRLVSPNGGPLN